METKTEHTPTPWVVEPFKDPRYDESLIRSVPADKWITQTVRPENAEFIVRAVNSYEALIELAKRVKSWREYWNERDQLSNQDDPIWKMADDALAKILDKK